MSEQLDQDIIAIEYWPHTAGWCILVAGIPVGYWPTKDQAETRARDALLALAAALSSDHGAKFCGNGAQLASRAPEEGALC